MKKMFGGVLMGMFAVVAVFLMPVNVSAGNADDPFVLVPEVENNDWTEPVDQLQDPNETDDFRKDYNETGDGFTTEKKLGEQLASGIVTWDTIILLITRIVKFVSNMALVVGSAMVIYAGYLYVMSVFAGDQTSKANEAIKDAVIGIVIVIFSYAIQRFVIEAFLA